MLIASIFEFVKKKTAGFSTKQAKALPLAT
jgi:hypothetical protein